jgi:prolyl oligopeptidase
MLSWINRASHIAIAIITVCIAASLAPSARAAPATGDPYLWLEPFGGPEVMKWVDAENAKTLAVLEKDPHFAGFFDAALAIAQAHDRIPTPVIIGGAIYNFWQDADHVRGIWRRTTIADYATKSPHWITVLDLDALAQQEKANWVWKGSACEGRLQRRCMLLLSDGGEDAISAREFDLSARHFVPGGFALPHGKQRVDWEDENTLLVAREFQPGELTKSGYPYILKRLKRGQALNAAQEIFRGTADDGGYGVDPAVFHDGAGHAAAVIQRPISTFEFEHYLVTSAGVRQLGLPPKSQVDALLDGRLIVTLKQDWTPDAQLLHQGSVVALDLAAVQADPQHLHPVVVFAPGPREAIQSVSATRSTLLVDELENVRGRLFAYTLQKDGSWAREVFALPENSTITVADADIHTDKAFVTVSGFLQPAALWSIDAATLDVAAIKALEPKFDAAHETVDQFEAVSSDGVHIPYFVVHRAGMALDGNNPTVINAYGGFEIARTPGYMAIAGKLWLEQGGVFVLANIRGGGEFGPAWHEAGLKTHRQIIYDDFVAVARDLIARRITSPRHLGIQGGSNGGLLVGVEMTQHPELWNAVDIAVPLLDMVRFEQIAAGTSWVGEYGSVANPLERDFLTGISPYAQLKPGVKYPEPFVWTTTKDDRVGPQHARKFAARLAEFGDPYLFYEVTEGGHGAGANLKETARTNAMEWTYFTRKLVGG